MILSYITTFTSSYRPSPIDICTTFGNDMFVSGALTGVCLTIALGGLLYGLSKIPFFDESTPSTALDDISKTYRDSVNTCSDKRPLVTSCNNEEKVKECTDDVFERKVNKSSKTGGYKTMGINYVPTDSTKQLDNVLLEVAERRKLLSSAKSQTVETERSVVSHSDILPRSQEMAIINSFLECKGMKVCNARDYLSAKGYKLHVLYNGFGPRMPLPTYDKTTIGVSIVKMKDGEDVEDGVICELVDVGGIDLQERGRIKL